MGPVVVRRRRAVLVVMMMMAALCSLLLVGVGAWLPLPSSPAVLGCRSRSRWVGAGRRPANDAAWQRGGLAAADRAAAAAVWECSADPLGNSWMSHELGRFEAHINEQAFDFICMRA